MRFRHWVMVLVLAWLHAPASAEPYRDVGGEAEVRHKTGRGLLLAEQQIAVNEEAQPGEVVKAKTEGEGDDVGSPNDLLKETAAPSEKDILPGEGKEAPRAKDLEETRKWLQKEYQALMEIQEEIHLAQKRRLGPNARGRLDEKIEDYSKRLGEYEKKGQAYDEDLAAFNALREEEKALRKELRETEIQLDKDYESLRAERLEIDRLAMENMARNDRKELAEKLRGYNARVKDYKERKEAFQKALESYNARIDRALEGSE